MARIWTKEEVKDMENCFFISILLHGKEENVENNPSKTVNRSNAKSTDKPTKSDKSRPKRKSTKTRA